VQGEKNTWHHKMNLHHSKAAMAVLSQQLTEGMSDVALVQQLWIYRGQIGGLTSSGGNDLFCCTRWQYVYKALYVFQKPY
jgi:hypothetical protein